MLRLIVLAFVLFAWGGQICNAQEFTPIVSTYDRTSYDADNQNWSVSSSDEGVICFGNGRGLLVYDGYRWQTYRLPDGKIARSVYADGGQVYVGSHEEFGYFSSTSRGDLQYRSLSALLEDYEMQNDEIWRIFTHDGKIVFQSFTSFFVYDGETVTAHRMSDVCLFFNLCDGKILTSADGLGLVSVDLATGSLSPIDDVPFDSQLVSALDCGDGTWIMVTYSDGLWKYDGKTFRRFRTEIDRDIASRQPNNAILTPSGDIVIGTKLKGAVCIDRNGAEVWSISNHNVLNSNTVLGMDFDRSGNLWLAMDGGLAKVGITPTLSYIRSISPSVGSIYTVLYREPYLYLGTGQGLYKGRLDKDFKRLRDVEIVPEILGNVWHIEDFDGQVICGTNYETFELLPNRTTVLSSVVGGICMDEGNINGKDLLIQGTYTNPCIWFREGGRWRYSHSLTDFVQPLNFIEIDHSGMIWAGHRYRGLYSLTLNSDLSKIDTTVFYPSLDGVSERPVSVYSVSGRMVFLDGVSGFYTYDYINDCIVPFKELNEAMKDYPPTSAISHFHGDLYWLISRTQATLVRFRGKNVSVEDAVQLSIFGSSVLDDSWSITPVSDDRCIIALGNSLAVYDASKKSEKNVILPDLSISRVVMSDLESHKDSLLPVSPETVPDVPYLYRNITIDYLFPHYDEAVGYSFSFSLDDKEWSEPSEIPSVSFAYLKKGNHVIRARALSSGGVIVSENEYRFRVVVPFYMSVWAYLIYSLLLMLSLAIGGYSLARTIKDKTIRKEKEELEVQIQVKSKELAASTLNLVQRNELLARIRKEITAGNDAKAVSIIDSSLGAENEWKTFEANFDNLHAHFFRNLRERYPSLTDNDLRFCAYLRLNLSSKDIASLMNISLKGVEAARARIRKKIGLSSSESLTAFMIDLK